MDPLAAGRGPGPSGTPYVWKAAAPPVWWVPGARPPLLTATLRSR